MQILYRVWITEGHQQTVLFQYEQGYMCEYNYTGLNNRITSTDDYVNTEVCANIIIQDVNKWKNFNREKYSNMNNDMCEYNYTGCE